MPLKVIPDEDKPSVAIEIPLEKPLPDYDLEDLEKSSPREVDAILVSQGFRDLVDDARGVLLEVLCEHHKTFIEESDHLTDERSVMLAKRSSRNRTISPISTSLQMSLIPWRSLNSLAPSVRRMKTIAPVYGSSCETTTLPRIRAFLQRSLNASITTRRS